MGKATKARRDVLFSIRPNYAELIVEGEKTVELRRRFSNDVPAGSFALIYCTSPVQAIIGVAKIAAIKRLAVSTIWSQYSTDACVDREYFDLYFEGRREGYAIVLDKARRFSKQIDAQDLRDQFGFTAPQSFVYLPKQYYKILKDERVQAPH